VTQIFGGWLTDRVGCSKSILIFSMSAMSLLSFISPVVAVWNSQAFFALRLLLGLASVCQISNSNDLLVRCGTRRTGKKGKRLEQSTEKKKMLDEWL
jgi:MFS family permease